MGPILLTNSCQRRWQRIELPCRSRHWPGIRRFGRYNAQTRDTRNTFRRQDSDERRRLDETVQSLRMLAFLAGSGVLPIYISTLNSSRWSMLTFERLQLRSGEQQLSLRTRSAWSTLEAQHFSPSLSILHLSRLSFSLHSWLSDSLSQQPIWQPMSTLRSAFLSRLAVAHSPCPCLSPFTGLQHWLWQSKPLLEIQQSLHTRCRPPDSPGRHKYHRHQISLRKAR